MLNNLIKKLKTNKNKEIINIFFINLAMLFVFVEVSSLAFYFINKKEFFYTRKNAPEKSDQKLAGVGVNEARLDESILQRIHPYFGYIVKPGLPFAFEASKIAHKINNYGFVSDYNYPLIKQNQRQFIVGIFGGSVANNYAVYELENKNLIAQLKKLPDLANKEIIVLSFASGGYKQPQQLLILNYFLSIGQNFDMVINIDGFNEVAIANLNNQDKIDLSMPSVQHILPLKDFTNNSFTPEEMTAIAKIGQYKTQLKKASEDLDRCVLASCYIFKSLSSQVLLKNYQKEVNKFDRLRKKKSRDVEGDSLIEIERVDSIIPDAIAFEKMADLWSNSSKLMKQTLSSQNALYFQFIQPNQYYPTQRVFSQEEKKIAILDKDNPYVDGVTKGYPVLFKKVDKLKEYKIDIFNGVTLFDDVKDIVYIDTCCHYNQKGSKIFSDYVAKSIVEVLSKDAKFTK